MATLLGFALVALVAGIPTAHATGAQPPVVVRTDDIDRFFRVYDATHGQPSVEVLQKEYLDAGSQALQQFVVARIGSAAKLHDAILARPKDFDDARACAAALATTRQQLPAVWSRLAALYPPAQFPPVTFVIGRSSTGGTTTIDGMVIGVETVCRMTQMGADLGPRFTHMIAHELAHIQQPAGRVDAPPGATLLFQALLEGGAEFMAEAASGEVSNVHLKTWTRGHECVIESAFAKDAAGSDVSHWLYNGIGTPDQPGDLGYWVGYRIAKAYVAQASDKQRAIADLLNVNPGNAEAFLTRSGWSPQTGC
ncbi:MAG: DUF2268 domain-containing putative Zn-dependent protease [Betaproteobacteria bacterium]